MIRCGRWAGPGAIGAEAAALPAGSAGSRFPGRRATVIDGCGGPAASGAWPRDAVPDEHPRPSEPSPRDAHRRRHVRRRGFERRRRPAQAAGLRRGGRHPPALRPRRGDPSARRLLRGAGHQRCPRGRRPSRHPPLRPRLRGPVPGRGDRQVRRELPRGRDPDSLRRVQPHREVPRPARARQGTRADALATGHTTWRAGLCPAAGGRSTGRRIRPETRATSSMRRRPSSLPSCAFRWARWARTRRGRSPGTSASPSRRSPTARTFASCRRAVQRRDRAASPGRRPPGGDRRPCRPDARPARGHPALHGRPAPGLGLSGREPLYVVRLEPETARVVVGPRSALATSRIRLTELNWLGDGDRGAVRDLPVAVRVRSTPAAARAPHPGWRGGGDRPRGIGGWGLARPSLRHLRSRRFPRPGARRRHHSPRRRVLGQAARSGMTLRPLPLEAA